MAEAVRMKPVFSFEEMFDDGWIDWIRAFRYTTVLTALLYALLVHPAKRWMEQREPYKLRTPLVVWNFIIGGFSIIGSARCVPVLIRAIRYDGFHDTICNNRYFSKDFIGTWGILFVLSKFPELVDTAFIILRKQRLIFLHWFHHAATLFVAWHMYSTRSSVSFWFCVMNYFVHSIMYTYYGFRAAGFRINRKIAMCVTTLQLSQMFMGIYTLLYAIYQKVYGVGCATEYPQIYMSLAVYITFLFLFAHFFFNAYIRSALARKSRDAVAADDKKVKNGVTKSTPSGPAEQLTNGMRRREKEGVAS